MTCERINDQLDDYLDGALGDDARWELESHVQYCEPCKSALSKAQAVQHALRAYPVTDPTPDFFDRAIAAAKDSEAPATTSFPWHRPRMAGLAAGLVALIASALLLNTPDTENGPRDTGAMAGVSMAMHETRTINLVFASGSELQGVSLTVDLPEGIELAGYQGLDQVHWTTRLQAGKNVLPLELVATRGSGGELVARLQHEGDEKVFTVSVAVI